MGLLDRFKRGDAGADALTREIAARLRARPDIEAAEPTGADSVAVTWVGGATSEESIAALREPWTSASGFDRIELVDQHLDTVQPPVPAAFDSGEPASWADEPPAAAATSWDAIRPGLLPRLRSPVDDGAVAWSLGGGLVEAVAVAATTDQPLRAAELERWNIDATQVREAAMANLRSTRPAPEPLGPGMRAWIATRPSGAQAAWLAGPDPLLEALGLASAVVLVPTPTDLVVVDAAADELVGSIVTDTLNIYEHEAEVRVCPVPFLISAGSVAPWDPAADDPRGDAVARAHELYSRLR